MRERGDLVEAFHNLTTPGDARQQMQASLEEIRRVAGPDSSRLFSYPYGQVSRFIADEYLPRQSEYVGAVTTEPRPLGGDCDPWRLPRYVCGRDWSSAGELERLLSGA